MICIYDIELSFKCIINPELVNSIENYNIKSGKNCPIGSGLSGETLRISVADRGEVDPDRTSENANQTNNVHS